MTEHVTMKEMLQAGAHFGHRTRYWNPKMSRYIFGSRNKIHIINLEQTMPLYHDAVNFMSKVVAKKGKVLFVGTKRAARTVVQEAADSVGMPYVNHRWLGGMLTNWKTVRQSIKRLKDMEKQRDEGVFDRMIKKEALRKQSEMAKLEINLGGIKHMGGLPDVLFVIDSDHERIAINEAGRLGIPVVAIVDTNSDPDSVDYVIPANDDAMRAIKLYLKGIVSGIQDSLDLIRLDAAGQAVESTQKATEPDKKPKPRTVVRHKATPKPADKAISDDATSVESSDEKAALKTVAQKAPAKTAEDKAEVKQASAKEAAAEKAPLKKTVVKKAPAKKAEPTAKKAAPKEAPAKKAEPTAKKAAPTAKATKKAPAKKETSDKAEASDDNKK